MLKATLTVPGGDLVAEVEIPPFQKLPEVLAWGSRHFALQEASDPAAPVYAEICCFFVPDQPPAHVSTVKDVDPPRCTMLGCFRYAAIADTEGLCPTCFEECEEDARIDKEARAGVDEEPIRCGTFFAVRARCAMLECDRLATAGDAEGLCDSCARVIP